MPVVILPTILFFFFQNPLHQAQRNDRCSLKNDVQFKIHLNSTPNKTNTNKTNLI